MATNCYDVIEYFNLFYPVLVGSDGTSTNKLRIILHVYKNIVSVFGLVHLSYGGQGRMSACICDNLYG